MAPKKRVRMEASSRSSSAPGTPHKPSGAVPATSQVSTLSIASTPTTPATASPPQSREASDKGMAPPPLPKAVSSNKQDESNRAGGIGSKVIHKTRSWYGSLPRKAVPSTSIQKETIAGSPLKAGSTPDLYRYDLKRTGDNASLSGASSASVNAPSKLHETTTPMDTEPGTSQSSFEDATDTKHDDNPAAAGTEDDAGGDADTPMPDAPASGWLGGWFGRAPPPSETASHANTQGPPGAPKEVAPEPSVEEPAAPASDEQPPPTTFSQRAASWLWPNMITAQDGSKDNTQSIRATSAAGKDAVETPMEEAPTAAAPEPTPKPAAGSSWAFWSRDTPKSPGNKIEPPESGELAVVGERSERHPKRTNSTDMSQNTAKAAPPKEPPLQATMSKDKGQKAKRAQPQSMDLDNIPPRPETPESDGTSSKTSSPSRVKAKTPTTITKSSTPNLLLPSFRGTYRMKDNPSIMKQISGLLLCSQQTQPKHVFLVKDPPKIKKAVAIGIHGLFPASYLRTVIGQPTGTSIKFAQHAADAIRRWAHSHGCMDEDLVIEKAALEGEGKIDQRVYNLWNLLQNWMDHIREADFILFATHSQGVPVSIMLLEKLIEAGAVDRAKVGVCAMAGVSLGPFPEYKGSMGMLMGSAAELWQFENSESGLSKRYAAAVKRVLAHGVRITYVGSIDDQLVPLDSSIYSPASHPYVYRAIFIDGRVHASDFIAHLVGFACKLRNLGISDHGLIRELSVPLAGSLYGGEGHSRLYDDEQVYDLAITHALETTNIGSVPCTITPYAGPTTANPYHLPWIMRGLLEENVVKTELSDETTALLRQFDEWKPTTKPLKDVKLRLDAIRSRL